MIAATKLGNFAKINLTPYNNVELNSVYTPIRTSVLSDNTPLPAPKPSSIVRKKLPIPSKREDLATPQELKPLPIKPLSTSYKDLSILSKIDDNTPQREYYKYDSTSNKFAPFTPPLQRERGLGGEVGFDPVRFSLRANKDSVAIGEEFELTITAEYLDVNPSLMFQFEGSNEYTLKMLLPEGFRQTGGTYYDYIQGKVTKENPKQEFTIKGVFESESDLGEFRLLRGAKGFNQNSSFYIVANKNISPEINSLIISNKYASTQASDCSKLRVMFGYSQVIGYETNTINLTIEAEQSYNLCASNRSEINSINFDLYKRRVDNSELFLKNVSSNSPNAFGTINLGVNFNDKESLKDGETIIIRNVVVESKHKAKLLCVVVDSWLHTCNGLSAEAKFCTNYPAFDISTTKTKLCGNNETSTISAIECLSGTVTWNTNPIQIGRTITVNSAGTYIATCTSKCLVVQSKSVIITKTVFNTPTIQTSGSGVGYACRNWNMVVNGCGAYPVKWEKKEVGSNTWNTISNKTNPSLNINYTNANPESQAGDYRVFCNNDGCLSDASSVQSVIFFPIPSPVISSTATSICAGEATFNATGCSSTVTWSTGAIGSSINVNSSGTYWAVCGNNCGISPHSNEITITSCKPSLRSGNSLCNATSTTNLIATGCEASVTPIFEKFNGSNWILESTPSSVGIGTYRVKCRADAPAAEISDQLILGVTSVPAVPSISMNKTSNTICGSGDASSITLTAIGCNGTIVWNTGDVTNSIVVSQKSGTYTAKCEETCENGAKKQSANSSPQVIVYSTYCDCSAIVVSDNTSFGEITRGQTLELEVPFTSGTTYTWTRQGSPITNTTINSNKLVIPGISLGQGGVYNVSISGCGIKDSRSITVLDYNPCPTSFYSFAYSNSPNSEISVGDELSFIAGGGEKYSWTGPNNFRSEEQFPKIPLVTLANSGNYNIKISKWVEDRYCDQFSNVQVAIANCSLNAEARFLEKDTVSNVTTNFQLNVYSTKSLDGATFEWFKFQSGSWQTVANYGNPTFAKTNENRGTYKLKVLLRGCEINDQINVQFIAPPAYDGHLDIATCNEVSGWIIDRNNQGLQLDYTVKIRIFDSNWQNAIDYPVTVNEQGTGKNVYFYFTPPARYKDGRKYYVQVFNPKGDLIQNTNQRDFRCCSAELTGNPTLSACIEGKQNMTVNITNAYPDATFVSRYTLEKIEKDEDSNSRYVTLFNEQPSNVFNNLLTGNYRVTYIQKTSPTDIGCKVSTGIATYCSDPTTNCDPPIITAFPGDVVQQGIGVQPKFYAEAPGLNTTPSVGSSTNVLYMRGSGSVSLPDMTDQNADKTAEILVKPEEGSTISVGDASDASRQRYLYTGYGGSTTTASFYLSVGANGINLIEFGNSFRRVACSYEGRISDWTHIAVVYQSNIASLYINGALVKTAASKPVGVDGDITILGPNNIGTDRDRGFKGYVRYARFWYTARTAQELADNISNTTLSGNKGLWVYDTFPIGDKIIKNNQEIAKLEGDAVIIPLGESVSPPTPPVLTWWLDGEKVATGNTYSMLQNLVKEGKYTITVKYTKPNGTICEAIKVFTVTNPIHGDLSGCYVIKTSQNFVGFGSGPGSVFADYQSGNYNRIRIHRRGDLDEDIWKLEHQNNGYYKIINNYVMDKVLGYDNNYGTMLKDRRVVDDTQIWKIVEEGIGSSKFKIIPKLDPTRSLKYPDSDTDNLTVPSYVQNDINQLFNLERTACPTPPKPCAVDNKLSYERWLNDNLKNDNYFNTVDVANYIKTNPKATYATQVGLPFVDVNTSTTSQFTSPAIDATSWREHHIVGRLSGYICPPATGNYAFYLKTNEWAALYISPEENPNGKKLIATQNGYTLDWPFAANMKLTQGRMYYFEIITKDIGPENIINHQAALAWKKPNYDDIVPVPLTHISSIPRDMKPLKKRNIGECALPPAEFTGTENLFNLFPKDKIYANNWEVTIEKVVGTGGTFTGIGTTFVKNKFLKDTKIMVEFNGITVNDEYELTAGVIKSLYDETKGNVVDVSDELKKMKDLAEAISSLLGVNLSTSDKKINFLVAEFRRHAELELPEELQIEASTISQKFIDAKATNNAALLAQAKAELQAFLTKKDAFLDKYAIIIKEALTQIKTVDANCTITPLPPSVTTFDNDWLPTGIEQDVSTPSVVATFQSEIQLNRCILAKSFTDKFLNASVTAAELKSFADKLTKGSETLSNKLYDLLKTSPNDTPTGINYAKDFIYHQFNKILIEKVYAKDAE